MAYYYNWTKARPHTHVLFCMRPAKCAAAALPGRGWHQPWSNPTPCIMHVFLAAAAAADSYLARQTFTALLT